MTYRIIKFRVWDHESKSFKKIDERWHLGILEFFDPPHKMRQESLDFFNNKRYTIEQFTGCFDEQLNEIYEGDIISVTQDDDETQHSIWFVEYHDGLGAFATVSLDYKKSGYLGKKLFQKTKIIGNIHENPDLLK